MTPELVGVRGQAGGGLLSRGLGGWGNLGQGS